MQITTKNIKMFMFKYWKRIHNKSKYSLTESLVLFWCLHQEAHFWEFISPTNIQSHKQDLILLQANLVSVGLPCTVKLLSSKQRIHCYNTKLLSLILNDYISNNERYNLNNKQSDSFFSLLILLVIWYLYFERNTTCPSLNILFFLYFYIWCLIHLTV